MAKKKSTRKSATAPKERGLGGKIRKGLGDVFGVKPRRKKAAKKDGKKTPKSGLGLVRKGLGDITGVKPKRKKRATKSATQSKGNKTTYDAYKKKYGRVDLKL